MGKKSVLSAFTMVLLLCTTGLGQANGKLQLHFMDVGQGDGAVLILRPEANVSLDVAG